MIMKRYIKKSYLEKQIAKEILSCYSINSKNEIFTIVCFCGTCKGLNKFWDMYIKNQLKEYCKKILK